MRPIDIENAIEEVDSVYGRIAFFRNDLYLGRSLREYGEWAQRELEFLKYLIEDGSVVVDAGAFIGTHTMAFSSFVGPRGKVYSFEPHPTYFRVLQRNLESNKLMNVKAFDAGLSERTGEMQVEELDLGAPNSLGSVRLVPTNSESNMLTVKITTLDNLGLDACRLIKVDVEGMESLVLSGGRLTIERHQPFVYAECNSADSAWPVVLMMRSFGYCIYLYSEEAYNPENYRRNTLNIFDHARELALVCVPPHLNDAFRRRLSPNLDVIRIDRLDDLVLCLIKKPQYKQEILANSNGAQRWGNDFWKNEGELEHLAERDGQIASLNQAVAERDGQIASLNQVIASLRNQLNAIMTSRSWKLTAPLRHLFAVAHRALASPYSLAIVMYRALPISPLKKQTLKNTVFRVFGFAFVRLGAYQRWKAYQQIRSSWPAMESAASTIAAISEALRSFTTLPSADGTWEWSDYGAVKSRISQIKAERLSQVFPSPLDLIDIGNESFASAAARVKLPTLIAAPDVSIILPVFNNLKLTLECLLSITAYSDSSVSCEIIVADDASTDETAQVIRSIPNLRLICNESNLGFLRNCNHALEHVQGKYVLYLNNDVQVTTGWLNTLLDTFESYPNVGAVGPRFVYPSGHLQEAGAAFRPDGTADMVGLNEDPSQARFSYTRRVDYVSGACLMLPTPLAKQLGGFSEDFLPCYCEDSDLCMRVQDAGYFVYCNPAAIIVHHLSKTTDMADTNFKLHSISKNLVTFQNKWLHRLDRSIVPKVIAFYLPQFHPFPENDKWWGSGFTEWTNVTKAQPNFVGHYQPRLPADLGFYDLRLSEVMLQQAELARRYGVQGFCFYYYWFGGKRLLGRPIEHMLATGKPDFPFCLCWANENWTRRWDGKDHEILTAQSHSIDDDKAVILDLMRFFRDKRYIRIDGRPLILVYRVSLFPNFGDTANRWRSICREQDIGEIYIAMVESFELVHAKTHPKEFGCDAAVEFPPQELAEQKPPTGEVINPDFSGSVADYRDLAVRYATREAPAYTRFMGVMPGWDNTARQQNNSFYFEHATPGAFQAWLEEAIEQTRIQHYGDERLVFVNAWNEWAEGAYLEPDCRFGHTYLEAVKNASEAAWLLRKERSIRAGRLSTMSGSEEGKDLCLVGHPYAPIGMGEHVRCTYRALRVVAIRPALTDIYKLVPPGTDELTEFSDACTDRPSDINVFHINGDEVEQALAHLSNRQPWSGYNIVYPAWELARYPKEWAAQLDRFEEIWAPSRFIQEALERVCTRLVVHMPLACEILLSSFLSRRYFGIPESDYVFLFFFDARSYPSRKNPQGVINAFRHLLSLRPYAKTRLILKVNGSELDPQSMEQLRNDLSDMISHVTLLHRVLSDNEVKNLVRCCDCFISLHRSEGYGRGIAEAMYLGKPVIATAYSGNMDFMTSDTSLEVGYQLVPVGSGEYPHWQDQVWANPDVDQATKYMVTLIDNPSFGWEIGRRASVHIRKNFGYRTTGVRYRQRLEHIARGQVV